MASTPFSARGAVDLGALAAARQNQQKAAQAMASAPPGVVIDVTAETFQAEMTGGQGRLVRLALAYAGQLD